MKYGENIIKDFADRTLKNLEAIKKLKEDRKKVYEVTQLVNSLLGLLVISHEKFFKLSIEKIKVDELRQKGCLIPDATLQNDQSNKTDYIFLSDLIRNLRNSIAHFHVEIKPGDNNEIRSLHFRNMDPARSEEDQKGQDTVKTEEKQKEPSVKNTGGRKNYEIDWPVEQLEDFLVKFIELMILRTSKRPKTVNRVPLECKNRTTVVATSD